MGLYFARQLPLGFDHFYGAGSPPFPTVRGGAGNPPVPAGWVPRGAGRPSLVLTAFESEAAWKFVISMHINVCVIKTLLIDPPELALNDEGGQKW